MKRGGFIEKGALIVRIDPRSYALEVKRRSVLVRQKEAELAQLAQQVKNLEKSNGNRPIRLEAGKV